MSVIEDLLKDWELKKHGWPAVVVALIWVGFEVFMPKDATCAKEVIYLQKTLQRNDSTKNELIREILIKNKIIDKQDSVYRVKVVEPSKEIIKKSKNVN